jgi:C4-dicarboxylate-specific signal transduction histidine kinase
LSDRFVRISGHYAIGCCGANADGVIAAGVSAPTISIGDQRKVLRQARLDSPWRSGTLTLVLIGADHPAPPSVSESEANLGDANTIWPGSELILHQLMEITRISALTEMASGLAHELNQPLCAIAVFSQAGERMLNRPEPLVGRALEVFRHINHEALGAGEAIQRIRRIFERDTPQRTRCQMPELIEELRPVLHVLSLRIKGDLRVASHSAVPDLFIDRLEIQHVLFALAQNAMEASAQMPDSPLVRIDVSADRYAVQTSITDSGPGVPADLRDQLFHPFFTTKPQGTGLGLASSRAIVESHEGTIGFDNLPTGGSCFWFRLPVAGTRT